MSSIFDRLIKLYNTNGTITQEDVEKEGMIYINRGTFILVIPPSNTDEHGDYLAISIKGHDCYSSNLKSTHKYRIVKGAGKFIVDGEEKIVKEGDLVEIPPQTKFTYMGKMLLTFEMIPDFKEENDIRFEDVKYVEYDEMEI